MSVEQFIASKIQKPPLQSFSGKVTKIGFVAVALTVAVMICAFCILFGFKKNIKERIFAMNGQLNIVKFTNSQSTESLPISTNEAVFTEVQKLKNVASIMATASKGGILKSKTDILGVVLKGVDLSKRPNPIASLITQGKFLEQKDSSIAYEVVISESIAQKLEVKLGEALQVYFMQNPPRVRKLKVVGIYESHFEEFDNQLIWVDLKLIQRINGWPADQVGAFEIQLKDFEQLNQTKGEIVKQMNFEMDIENVKSKYLAIFDWLSLLDANLYLFIGILFFVASFNMVSVLIVLIMERIPMVGLLQAFGSTNFSIQKIFLIVGQKVILKGLFWGNLIGFGICAIQYFTHLIPLNPANYFINYVPIAFDTLAIIGLNVFTLLMGFVILIIPSFLIRKIRPVQALAFKK